MLNTNEVEELRTRDYAKTIWSIESACRGAAFSDRTIFAASYVLMRALEDYQISVDSIDYYFKTANEMYTRELFIRQSLEGCWDKIRELKYKFTADDFKAVLLFYNGSVNKGWDSATPDGVSRLAAKILNVKPGMKILDIGTGPGVFAVILNLAGHDTTGIDISPNMLQEAGKNAEKYGASPRFLLMDCEEPEFDDCTFDMIVSRNVVWIMQKPEKAYRQNLATSCTVSIETSFPSASLAT